MSEEKAKYKTLPTLAEDLRLTYSVRRDVKYELFRQRDLYGVQRHPHGLWLAILGEEFGEVCEALQSDTDASKDSDASDLYKELVQVAAVAISYAAQVKEEEHQRRG